MEAVQINCSHLKGTANCSLKNYKNIPGLILCFIHINSIIHVNSIVNLHFQLVLFVLLYYEKVL